MKRTEEKVIRFIKENNLITEGDKILVALSGGADSVFLLYFLHKFKNKYKIQLGALHINHMLRGKAAADDEQFCSEFCRKLKVKFYSVKKNVSRLSIKDKISIEEAGRFIRYKELEKTAIKEQYNKIATAHNSNDNSETVLLNLIKGTGVKGLAGIPIIRNNIIRPVLPVKRNEIEDYLRENSLSFRVDESNTSDDYERNFLRHQIIPRIKDRLNPSFEDAVFNTSSVMKIHYTAIQKKTEHLLQVYARKEKDTLFLSSKIKDENEAVRTELLKLAIERNFSVQLSFKDVTALTSLFGSSRGKSTRLLSGLSASREKDELVIFREKSERFDPIVLTINEKVRLNSKYLYISEAEKSSFTSRKPGEEYIAADDADTNFIVREWKEGDRFFPLGMKGSKKVSDYLNERKIETYLKHKVLLLTNRGRIVWVIGLRLDNRFRVTENSKTVLRLCLK